MPYLKSGYVPTGSLAKNTYEVYAHADMVEDFGVPQVEFLQLNNLFREPELSYKDCPSVFIGNKPFSKHLQRYGYKQAYDKRSFRIGKRIYVNAEANDLALKHHPEEYIIASHNVMRSVVFQSIAYASRQANRLTHAEFTHRSKQDIMLGIAGTVGGGVLGGTVGVWSGAGGAAALGIYERYALYKKHEQNTLQQDYAEMMEKYLGAIAFIPPDEIVKG